VLVSSSSPIRPYSAVALNLLRGNLAVLYADTDAKFRNEILSNTRHMIERCRGAIAFLTRELENSKFLLQNDQAIKAPPQQALPGLLDDITSLLEIHKKFIRWFVEFLSGELVPTASYQRHITALKAIGLLLRSGISNSHSSPSLVKASDNAAMWPYTIDLFQSGIMRLILDLLMDPFEDVRSNASIILKFASQHSFKPVAARENDKVTSSILSTQNSLLGSSKVTTPKLLMHVIERGQAVSKRTGRADYADGLARSYEVMYGLGQSMESRYEILEGIVEQLETKVKICEDDLARAVLEAPIHGSFAALR
jgi:hypothetical protein